MPTTLVGLVLFVVLLVPGFTYTLIRERVAPDRRHSIFRETISIAFVSIVSEAAAVALFIAVSTLVSIWRIDFDALVRQPEPYFQVNYRQIILTCALLVVGATVMTSVAALPWTSRSIRALRAVRAVLGERADEPFFSAWTKIFVGQPDAYVHVGCNLDDGSFISGYLDSWTRSSEDLPDRDLTLIGDIKYRAPGDAVVEKCGSVSGAVISARRIVSLMVTYVKDPDGS
ncbi:DUF6338 family protein [Fodinicola acaciae]|uniref:DUF6338 family protein n=1 Tax=Fodinicola acaciae TaxID=2681555 RepID=UPI0013D72012|nr:DUF6338 family protein [Fodinicola acaciae]